MKSNLIIAVLLLYPLASIADSLDSPRAVCEAQAGGSYEQGRSTDDIAPLCTIDGGLIEYWTLHRVVKEGKSTSATKAFLTHPQDSKLNKMSVDDKPSAYCRFVKGRPVLYRDAQGISFGMCEFKDKSAIAEHTLLVGPRTYTALASILKRRLK